MELNDSVLPLTRARPLQSATDYPDIEPDFYLSCSRDHVRKVQEIAVPPP
jgi:hypothetical protein